MKRTAGRARGKGRPQVDPNVPPEQFLRTTDNGPLLNRVRAMAEKTAAARAAAATASAKARTPVAARGAARASRGRQPLPIRELASDWAAATSYDFYDSSESVRSESDAASSCDGSSSLASEDAQEFEVRPVATRVASRQRLPDGVVDLAYIVKHKPPSSIVRNFIRAQIASLEEAALEDEFA